MQPVDVMMRQDKMAEFCTSVYPQDPNALLHVLTELNYVFYDRISHSYMVPLLISSYEPRKKELVNEIHRAKERKLNR